MAKALILIADDDRGLTVALKKRLIKEGYAVITASDSYNALALTLQSMPDVCLLDINMPAGDGFTVQERIQAIGSTKHPRLLTIPILYMTGDKSERLDDLAEDMGAFAILHKPFEYRLLVEVIEKALTSTPTQAS